MQVYITDFGKKEDIGLVAEIDKKIVGAVWVRIMDDYGHIDNDTPSFAISLYKDYRGFEIGTDLRGYSFYEKIFIDSLHFGTYGIFNCVWFKI